MKFENSLSVQLLFQFPPTQFESVLPQDVVKELKQINDDKKLAPKVTFAVFTISKRILMHCFTSLKGEGFLSF